MKKLLLITVMLLLLVVGGIGAYYFMAPDLNAAVQVSQDKPSAKDPAKQPEIGVMKPVETTADMLEQLSYERTQNPDTIGWLKIPNTEINNTVLQSYNNVYYLRLSERKEQDVFGCYFADYTCSFGTREELSPNTIIYGHSDLKDNPDGRRFSQLLRFTQEEFAKNNPYIYFSTMQDQMVWQIFAVFYTDTDMNYIKSDLNEQELTGLVEEAKRKSIYHYDVPVDSKDKLLSLSTCTVKYGDRKDQRFVVMAKLMPADYVQVDTASLTVNPNPEQPSFN
ncbi:class B sortase [Oscillospiraceae bacterium PP1C4]